MNTNIEQYYRQRAGEYEKIYQKPERQKDIDRLKSLLITILTGKNVLEIACGTGYWTQFIAENAGTICAIDCNSEVLEIARLKNYKQCKVSFLESNAYLLENIKGEFSGGFCGFWWSHIPKSKVNNFMKIFHSKLTQSAIVVMIDNKYVEGSSTPISRTDNEGNTYQIRKLEDGTKYEVLKNFPSEQEIRTVLKYYSKNIEYIDFQYYWLVKYQIN
jgi:SAM-dependent methyltransferase